MFFVSHPIWGKINKYLITTHLKTSREIDGKATRYYKYLMNLIERLFPIHLNPL